MNVDYPYAIDTRGRTALADDADHLRDLLEQVLFTAPGERVNRPTFGCGLMELVFGANSEALGAAVQAATHAALNQWLGDVIAVSEVAIAADDAKLVVTVGYTVRRTGDARVVELTRSV